MFVSSLRLVFPPRPGGTHTTSVNPTTPSFLHTPSVSVRLKDNSQKDQTPRLRATLQTTFPVEFHITIFKFVSFRWVEGSPRDRPSSSKSQTLTWVLKIGSRPGLRDSLEPVE